jgi:hypothetical protein
MGIFITYGRCLASSAKLVSKVDYKPDREYQPIARIRLGRSEEYKYGVDGRYYILSHKHAGTSRDFWIVACQSYMVDLWPRYLHYMVRSRCAQKSKTAFFYAKLVGEDHRYVVKEVSGLGDHNNYISIGL